MPYDHIVFQLKNKLKSGAVAVGEAHSQKGDAFVAARQVVLRLIREGVVRKLFIEWPDVALEELDFEGDKRSLGELLREWADKRAMGALWPMLRLYFQNQLNIGPGPEFIEEAVRSGVLIYLSDLAPAPPDAEAKSPSGPLKMASDEGVHVRNLHWARIFKSATKDGSDGALVLVGADHLKWLRQGDDEPVYEPLWRLCGIVEDNVSDLSKSEVEKDAKAPGRALVVDKVAVS